MQFGNLAWFATFDMAASHALASTATSPSFCEMLLADVESGLFLVSQMISSGDVFSISTIREDNRVFVLSSMIPMLDVMTKS